jgi:hypothetical protein
MAESGDLTHLLLNESAARTSTKRKKVLPQEEQTTQQSVEEASEADSANECSKFARIQRTKSTPSIQTLRYVDGSSVLTGDSCLQLLGAKQLDYPPPVNHCQLLGESVDTTVLETRVEDFSERTFERRFKEVEPLLEQIVALINKETFVEGMGGVRFNESGTALARMHQIIIKYFQSKLLPSNTDRFEVSPDLDKSICDNICGFINSISPTTPHKKGSKKKEVVLVYNIISRAVMYDNTHPKLSLRYIESRLGLPRRKVSAMMLSKPFRRQSRSHSSRKDTSLSSHEDVENEQDEDESTLLSDEEKGDDASSAEDSSGGEDTDEEADEIDSEMMDSMTSMYVDDSFKEFHAPQVQQSPSFLDGMLSASTTSASIQFMSDHTSSPPESSSPQASIPTAPMIAQSQCSIPFRRPQRHHHHHHQQQHHRHFYMRDRNPDLVSFISTKPRNKKNKGDIVCLARCNVDYFPIGKKESTRSFLFICVFLITYILKNVQN